MTLSWGNPSAGMSALSALPLDMLHDDEGLALVLADLMDGADVGVVQGRGTAGFLEQPR